MQEVSIPVQTTPLSVEVQHWWKPFIDIFLDFVELEPCVHIYKSQKKDKSVPVLLLDRVLF